MTEVPKEVNKQPENVPVAQPATQAPKENVAAKALGGISWWINSLMGKPSARTVPGPSLPSAAPPPPTVALEFPDKAKAAKTPEAVTSKTESRAVETKRMSQDATGEDPVVQDLATVKKLFGVFSSKVSKTVSPAVTKGVESSTKAATSFVKSADPKFIQKLIRIFIIIVVLVILGFVGFKFYQQFQKDSKNGGIVIPGGDQSPTPTSIVFEPEKPSVYADDPIILKLEEDINVLVREIVGTNIKETSINPPVLHFNISF